MSYKVEFKLRRAIKRLELRISLREIYPDTVLDL
jgi:hypothetical protein